MPRSGGIDRVVERVIVRLSEIEQVYGRGVREQQSRVFLAELREECAGAEVERRFLSAYQDRFLGSPG